MKLKLKLPPAPDMDENTLHDHLLEMLHSLPYKPSRYDETQLIDHLCFILRSPAFLYAIKPRLSTSNFHGKHSTERETLESFKDPLGNPKDGIDITKLNMSVNWGNNSWATQLRFGDCMLIEGRQINVKQKEGFAQSFKWFCEEAKFLWYEFRAREMSTAALTEIAGTPPEMKPQAEKCSLVVKLPMRQTEKKQRRLIRLKVRIEYIKGRPALARK